jgi:hypothetical protein
VAVRRELKFDLRIGPGGVPFDENAWAAGARRVSQVAVEDGRARVELASADFTNQEVVIGVKAVGSNGKDAGWSNFAVLPVLPPPERPRELRADSAAGGVALQWQAAGTRWRIDRRQADAEFAPLATVQAPRYLDASAEPGQRYAYRVRTVALFGDKEAESEPSDEAAIVPVDRFPPGAPAGLTVLGSTASIELNWEPNAEPDLAAYRIYRAAPNESFRKLGESAGIPSFSDRAVEAGKQYRYAVTAVDRTGNEGPRSATVEGSLP